MKLDKFEQLYQTGKAKTSQKREAEDKTADEAAIERNPEAFTFKPTVNELNLKALSQPNSALRSKSRKNESESARESKPPVFKRSPKKVIKQPVDQTVGPETV